MKLASVVLVCLLTFQMVSYAQSAGAIRGSVQDPSGAVVAERPRAYPLANAAAAHADLEGRRTTGSLILIP